MQLIINGSVPKCCVGHFYYTAMNFEVDIKEVCQTIPEWSAIRYLHEVSSLGIESFICWLTLWRLHMIFTKACTDIWGCRSHSLWYSSNVCSKYMVEITSGDGARQPCLRRVTFQYLKPLMSLLIRYSHIPFYFHFSITFSTWLIHHYAPPLTWLHAFTSIHDTCLRFIRPALLIWWTDVLWFTCFISILICPMCTLPWPNQSQILTLCGQALTMASLQMSLMLAFLFTICI